MNIPKAIRQINLKLAEKYKEIITLKAELRILQSKCPHPPEKRTVVTDSSDLNDFTSCDDCGKTLS